MSAKRRIVPSLPVERVYWMQSALHRKAGTLEVLTAETQKVAHEVWLPAGLVVPVDASGNPVLPEKPDKTETPNPPSETDGTEAGVATGEAGGEG